LRLKVLGILGALVVFPLGAYAVWLHTLTCELADVKRELRNAGIPTTFEELNEAYPAVPDNENAALLYEGAFAAARFDFDQLGVDWGLVMGGGGATCGPPGRPLPEDIFAETAKYVDMNAEALRLCAEGARFTRCRYSIELDSQHIRAPPPSHLGKTGVLAGLLRARSLIQAEREQYNESVESLCNGIALANSLRNEPLTVSQLICLHHRHTALRGVEWIINKTQLSEAQLELLSDKVATFDDRGLIKLCFASEQVSVPAYFGDAMRGEGASAEFMYKTFIFSPRERLRLTKTLKQMYDLHKLELPDALRESRRIQAEVDPEPGRLTFLPQAIITAFVEKNARLTARSRCLRTALAIERHRLKHGRPPGALEELVPDFLEELLTDPFDGKPLRFAKREVRFTWSVSRARQKEASGERRSPRTAYSCETEREVRKACYMVYSVGGDGVDDGGTPYRKYGDRAKSDLTCTVAR